MAGRIAALGVEYLCLIQEAVHAKAKGERSTDGAQ